MTRLMTAESEVIVRLIHRNGQARLAEVNTALGKGALSPRKLSRRIEHLCDMGWIEKAAGGTSNAAWRPTAEALPLLRQPGALPTRPVPSRFRRAGPRPPNGAHP